MNFNWLSIFCWINLSFANDIPIFGCLGKTILIKHHYPPNPKESSFILVVSPRHYFWCLNHPVSWPPTIIFVWPSLITIPLHPILIHFIPLYLYLYVYNCIHIYIHIYPSHYVTTDIPEKPIWKPMETYIKLREPQHFWPQTSPSQGVRFAAPRWRLQPLRRAHRQWTQASDSVPRGAHWSSQCGRWETWTPRWWMDLVHGLELIYLVSKGIYIYIYMWSRYINHMISISGYIWLMDINGLKLVLWSWPPTRYTYIYI